MAIGGGGGAGGGAGAGGGMGGGMGGGGPQSPGGFGPSLLVNKTAGGPQKKKKKNRYTHESSVKAAEKEKSRG